MYKLRELERDDIPVLNEWRNNPDFVTNLGAPFRFINKEVDFSWFDNYMKCRNSTVRCAILDDNDQFIGVVSLVNIDHLNQSAEFHIMIGAEECQNKGAGKYATMKILEHAFNNLNLRRVELTVLVTNERAIHLYEKVGFTREGLKRQARFKQGKYVDMYLYSILREEYPISQ